MLKLFSLTLAALHLTHKNRASRVKKIHDTNRYPHLTAGSIFKVSFVTTILTTTVSSALLSPSAMAGSTANLSGAGAKVVVYNVSFDGQKFIGRVLNNSGKKLKFLKLHYQLLNGQGQMVDTGNVYIMEDELIGFQNGTFRLRVLEDSGATNLAITSAEWLD